jgi:Glycosyl transferase family 2
MPFERAPAYYANPLLSIVVAAYNVDGYIEEALESLLSQPYIDAIRVIVVDDGSTDDTFAAAQTVVERDGGHHIEVIRQSNRGVSAARNTGIAAVRTPYVGFLDGDDIYLRDFTRQVMPLLAQHRWDMVEYNIKIIDDDGHELDELELVSPSENGECALDLAAQERFANGFHTFVWARIFRVGLFKNVQFPLGRHYEDMAIVPSLHLLAKNVYRVSEPLYGYRRRFGSITQKSALSHMHDLRAIGLEALARCDGSETDDFWLTIFDKAFQRACHVCARVDRTSFPRASETLRTIAADHHTAVTGLAKRFGRQVVELKPFDLHVRVDRLAHQMKGIVKKFLRRRLDHHQRERRVTLPNQQEGEA